jgi:DNA-directed RNA polymerase specialized sigma24 family protein
MPQVTREEVDAITRLTAAIIANLRRSGRLPTRLNEEDFDDLSQEGILTCLELLPKFDPARGSLGAYMARPAARAILAAAWQQAQVGITGTPPEGVQVWGESDGDGTDLLNTVEDDDVAAEIEAFDYVWHLKYSADQT